MVTSASLRLPLRLLSRRATANPIIPSTSLLRSQHSADPPKHTVSRRHTSTAVNPPDAPSEVAISNQPPESTDSSLLNDVRLPRAVQAVYLRPLRKQAQFGVPSCDLQMRSYNVRNLEFFADFAMRAAYYLGLPAYGPVPLPRIVERWTVPRASFVFKKSQENFERKTLRRLIQIKDGHPETVEIWLAFLKKHAYYGIGMKANVWNYEKLDVGKNMDIQLEGMKDAVDERLSNLGFDSTQMESATAEKIMEFIDREDFNAASGTSAPMARKTPMIFGESKIGGKADAEEEEASNDART